MPSRPVRLTPAGWVALVSAAVLLVVGVVVVAHRLTGSPDCTVREDGRTVGLDQREAEAAASAMAAVVRRSGDASTARRALTKALPLSSTDAQVVADALTGHAQAALSCRHGGSSTAEADRLDPRGLTGRAEAVRRDVLAAFGPLPLGGFAPGGVHSGHMPGSAHYEGRAIDVFFRPITPEATRAGWQTAMWAVAHADRLHVATVIFDRQIWTTTRSLQDWRDYSYPGGATDNPVLLHEDHVHLDVQRGG